MKDSEVARLLSLILRHEPERIGLTLDGQGWANVPDLIRLAKRAGKPFDLATLQRVVETNDKRRFTLSPDGLRRVIPFRSISAYPPSSRPIGSGMAPPATTCPRSSGMV